MSPPGIEDDLFDEPAPPAKPAAAASLEDDLFADPPAAAPAPSAPPEAVEAELIPPAPVEERRRTDRSTHADEVVSQISRPASPSAAPRPVASPTVVTHPNGTAMSQLGLESLRVLQSVEMELSVELGRARIPVREILELAPGSIMELDRAAGSPVDVLVNGTLLARGEVVVVDDEFGVRITELLGGSDDIHELG